MSEAYKPQNSMGWWWLGAGPGLARLIGQLLLADGNRKVALEYDPAWTQTGFALSEDLPLARGVFLPKERGIMRSIGVRRNLFALIIRPAKTLSK
jgi:serine/threonine-protein kinase HipA